MSLVGSQLSPLQLRNRSVPRHVPHVIPRGDNITKSVENYVENIVPKIRNQSVSQQIHYWSCKVAESVHICVDIMMPEFDNFASIVMLRWLTIGNAVCQLVEIWKTNKHNISTHNNVREWLPDIIKQKLPPNLLPRGSYSKLRIYARLWENREIITKLPKLRGEHTHRLYEMNKWLRFVLHFVFYLYPCTKILID